MNVVAVLLFLIVTHLHLHANNPDLYNHLLCALNSSQISLRLNPQNIKSATRRIITLYRLGIHQFADEILKNMSPKDITPKCSALIKSEKDKIESQSVKYHVDRFKHALLTNDE